MTETSAPTPDKTKYNLSDYAKMAFAVIFFGSLVSSGVDDFMIGDKDEKFCNDLKSQYAQAVSDIQNLDSFPNIAGHPARLEIAVTMSKEDVGSFLPWGGGKTCYISDMTLQ